MPSRRRFIVRSLALPIVVAGLAPAAPAAGLPMLDEKDPTAAALGYVADAGRADKAKYPRYAAGQACANCQLYQGKAGDASGPCPLYAGKQVSSTGWCSAYAKKS
jgi:hypothetical protein